MIVTDQQYAPVFLKWMRDRIGGDIGEFDANECRTIAHVMFHEGRDPEILAVVAINRWSPFACEGNIASDGTRRWFSRDFAFTVYDFVFRHAAKTRFNFTVSVDNEAAIGMHEKLGHKYVACLEDAFGEDNDAFIYGLTRKQWLAGPWSKPSKQEK
ncbi:GNAT family N-acetyltransferase [Massilia suwonensis]|uniref:GNAT family N-acetyltransferase n=1 Tax=Massilia suwonensis TaxID=648895 RepID=A0ABW0MER8_9BURK